MSDMQDCEAVTGGGSKAGGSVRGVIGAAVVAMMPLASVGAQPPADARPWAQGERSALPSAAEAIAAHGSKLMQRTPGNRVEGGERSGWRHGDAIEPQARPTHDSLSIEDRAMLRLHIREQGQAVYKR
ncbi:hypothetical protein [Derxia lacustris]|uniref:hypothetical protein n=1 Tax=Derxia lacustris TaxID=764842 RepID=UPI000A1758A6|nr:hypothetical protein [Derxia lacustris]